MLKEGKSFYSTCMVDENLFIRSTCTIIIMLNFNNFHNALHISSHTFSYEEHDKKNFRVLEFMRIIFFAPCRYTHNSISHYAIFLFLKKYIFSLIHNSLDRFALFMKIIINSFCIITNSKIIILLPHTYQ